MGESYGRYELIDDALLMPYIDACNIACGFHAGDPSIMETTIRKALRAGLEIGAHPSYPDRDGFGRRFMEINESDLTALIKYQICALMGMVIAQGGELNHVKVHGALYNQAAKNLLEARAIVKAVSSISKNLLLYAPPNSILSEQGTKYGLTVFHEAFIDRRYNEDGSLVSRSLEKAVIHNGQLAWQQVRSICEQGEVQTINGAYIPILANTFCIHGDNPNALSILQTIQIEREK